MSPDPQSFIPGYRIRYIELETVCAWLKDNGWAGGIGFDEAVKAMALRDTDSRDGLAEAAQAYLDWHDEQADTVWPTRLITLTERLRRALQEQQPEP